MCYFNRNLKKINSNKTKELAVLLNFIFLSIFKYLKLQHKISFFFLCVTIKVSNNNRNALMRLITNTFLTWNISMAIKPIKVCNILIYKFVFDLPESSKITWLKYLFGRLIKTKLKEKIKKK